MDQLINMIWIVSTRESYLIRVMRVGGLNMSVLTVNFTYQDSFQSV